MPVQVLRPNGIREDLVPRRTTIAGGAATRQAAVSDNSDTTSVRRSSAGNPIAAFSLTDPTPNGDPIRVDTRGRTKAYIKIAGYSNWTLGRMGLGRANGTTLQSTPLYTLISHETIATQQYTSHLSRVQGGAWTWQDLDDLLVIIDEHPSAYVGLDFNEVYVDVYSLLRPTATPALVGSSPVTATSFPQFSIALEAVVEQWQIAQGLTGNTIELRLFTQAAYQAAGFNAKTADTYVERATISQVLETYTDGVTASSVSVPWTPTQPLSPTGVYRLYAWAKRDGGQDGVALHTGFSMNITPSTPPVIDEVNVNNYYAGVRITLDLTPSATHTEPKLAALQRSTDDGETWVDVPLYYHYAFPPSDWFEVFDFTAPRGVPFKYRAKMQTVKASARLMTDWSATTAAYTLNASGWWFRMLGRQSRGADGEWVYTNQLVVRDLRVVGRPDEERGEDISVFRPDGRRYPVIMHGSLQGSDGSYDIITATEAEWLDLQAILDCQKPVYVDTGFNDSKWITFMPYRVRRLGTPTSPRREISVPYVESAPLDELPYPAFEE